MTFIQESEAENAAYQNVAIMHQLQCVNYIIRMKAMIHQ